MAAPQKQIVFIAGSGHSGSTLLDMCLGGHADIAALGETGFLYFYAHKMSARDFCTCGESIDTCPFWVQVVDRLAVLRGLPREKALDDFILSDPAQMHFDDNGDYRERLPEEPKVNESILRPLVGIAGSALFFRLCARLSKRVSTRLVAAQNRMLLLQAVLESSDRHIALDSTKSPGTIKEAWMARQDIPVKFIALHRDGRGVAASHMKRLGLTLPQAACAWRNEIIKWFFVSLTIPKENILTLHYEDFASQPQETLRRVCDFLQISYDEKMLQFREGRHNIGGNKMRFRKGETEIKLDEKWRENLSAQDLAVFDRKAGWVNRLLGYKE